MPLVKGDFALIDVGRIIVSIFVNLCCNRFTELIPVLLPHCLRLEKPLIKNVTRREARVLLTIKIARIVSENIFTGARNQCIQFPRTFYFFLCQTIVSFRNGSTLPETMLALRPLA
ncbi:Uncharacterised protein [Cronobacter universalis NCTC 9529]|uniref:Uncharacterized protein n=1 Tax=Cronobacter universalis NCTC 9529 TaxID=1074000 RepID=A0ABY1W8L8_9ENTR|nr:Uncharacterised protein [Cronobacter universalis NCTC 9529]